MERTLAELAQLFIDVPPFFDPFFLFLILYFQMGTLVEQHDAVINQVEETARVVEGDTEKG